MARGVWQRISCRRVIPRVIKAPKQRGSPPETKSRPAFACRRVASVASVASRLIEKKKRAHVSFDSLADSKFVLVTKKGAQLVTSNGRITRTSRKFPQCPLIERSGVQRAPVDKHVRGTHKMRATAYTVFARYAASACGRRPYGILCSSSELVYLARPTTCCRNHCVQRII